MVKTNHRSDGHAVPQCSCGGGRSCAWYCDARRTGKLTRTVGTRRIQSPWTDLNQAGSAYYESGFNIGAGAGLSVHPNLALRAGVTWARSDAVAPTLESPSFSRLFYWGDLQLLRTFDMGLQPYAFAGVGGARITRRDTDDDAVNSPALRVGAGLAYAIPGTRFSVFGQGAGWYYKFYGWPGLDHYLWDASYSVGVSVSLDLGID